MGIYRDVKNGENDCMREEQCHNDCGPSLTNEFSLKFPLIVKSRSIRMNIVAIITRLTQSDNVC